MRAPRWPNTGTRSSIIACCCELASKSVRAPALGVARESETVGLRNAPACARSARAMSASSRETATRGLLSTMRSTSSSVTAAGTCWAHTGPATNARARLSRLIFFLRGDVALFGQHVIDARQHEERDDQRGHHAADDDERERTLRLAADALRERHRQKGEEGEQRRHQDRAQLLHRALDDRLVQRPAAGAVGLDRSSLQQAEERDLAEERDEAHHGAHRERHAAELEREHAARQRERRGEQDRRCCAARLELA